MSIKIGNDVKNQGQAPAMITGLDENKPAAGQKGRLYYSTNTNTIYLDNGTAWVVFIVSAGGTINVSDKYLPVANGANTLVNSNLYQESGSIALNNNNVSKGKFSITDNATRLILGVVNVSTAGDDTTSEIRFYGYDGTTINPLGQVYQTNNNQVTTNSFPNSLNLKAFLPSGKIVFIVGGNTSANIKGFINNAGNWIIGGLNDSGLNGKMQITGKLDVYSTDGIEINNLNVDYPEKIVLNLGGLRQIYEPPGGNFQISDWAGNTITLNGNAGVSINVTDQFIVNASGYSIFNSAYFQVTSNFSIFLSSINIGNGNDPDPCAKLQIDSSTQGFLMPRMSTLEINSITNPLEGLQVFNTTLHQPCFFDGTGWRKVSHSSM